MKEEGLEGKEVLSVVDTFSAVSVKSLLSDWDEDDAESELEDACDEHEKLKRQFAYRDTLLQRIGKGKSKAYLSSLIRHEELVRVDAFRMLEQRTKTTTANSTAEEEKKLSMETEIPKSPTAPNFFARILLFEGQVAFPGLVGLLGYCSFHLAAYEATQSIVLESARIVSHETITYFGSILFALVVTRLTGGVFDWVSVERHAQAKFDLHNRIRLGYWDAKIHLWFRNRPRVKFAVDLVAIYLCLVGMSYLHYRVLAPLFSDRSWLLDNLPSRNYDVETPIALWLKHEITLPCDSEIDKQCSLRTELTNQDESYLSSVASVSSVNNLLGASEAVIAPPLLYQATHILIACCAALMLGKLGVQWH